MPFHRPRTSVAALGALAFAAAPASASPVTIMLNDGDQRFNTPAGQSLLVRSIEWLAEADTSHEMVHFSPSGFGSSIQVFKPSGSDVWTPSLNPQGVFLAADGAMPPALAMSLNNTRVDWRDVAITGELIDNSDAAAWAAALNDPSLASQSLEAVTITLNDANPTYVIPAGQRFVARNVFFHLDGGASDRELFLTAAGGGLTRIDLDSPIATAQVTFSVEPGNDRVARFSVDSTAAGFAELTIDDGSGADYVDVSISGFLVAQTQTPPPPPPCAVSADLVGDWTLLDVTIRQGAVTPPDISDTSGFALSIACDGAYVEDATGGVITPGPDLPPGIPYNTCTYLAGGSSGQASSPQPGQVAFSPASVTADEMDCGYTDQNSFAVHVHQNQGPWSYQVVGDQLTLSSSPSPNVTISSIWER